MMFGPRAGDVAAIEAMGFPAFVAQQLNPSAINDSACTALLNTLPRATLSESWAQLYDRRSNATWNVVIAPFTETRHATIVRMSASKRQLFERMVEFWHNHFSIYGQDFIVRSLFTKWDETIRTHALGNFRQFLEATATHPCMLYYLDNYISTNAGPNENYARELFELHTLGAMNYQVPGGYVDDDVYEASRCFTGWTFERTTDHAMRGQFKYVNEQHDRFMKWVLGTRLSADQAALKDGRDVLDLLAFHPGTARHICWKLAQRFVADVPPESLVASMTAVFIANKNHANQIRLVLEHLFLSAEFQDPQYRFVKLKRPIDWLASFVRALNVTYPVHDAFWWNYFDLGQRMFEWRPPDGPPDVREHWATSNGMLQRWNYVYRLASGWWTNDNYTLSVDGLMPNTVRTPRAIVEWWLVRCVQRPVADATMEGLIQFIAEGRSSDLPIPEDQVEDKLKFLAATIVMCPEFQWR
jgi:uncharacterized protein (DUF1800 family)